MRRTRAWFGIAAPAGTPKDVIERFQAEMKKALTSQAMDPAIEEELDAFVARRKAEGGAPTDF